MPYDVINGAVARQHTGNKEARTLTNQRWPSQTKSGVRKCASALWTCRKAKDTAIPAAKLSSSQSKNPSDLERSGIIKTGKPRTIVFNSG